MDGSAWEAFSCGSPDAQAALEASLAEEPEPLVLAELKAALDRVRSNVKARPVSYSGGDFSWLASSACRSVSGPMGIRLSRYGSTAGRPTEPPPYRQAA
jgi:hypothetical protein